jgi:oxygen-independent coproporphyrinogen-3 oxidase
LAGVYVSLPFCAQKCTYCNFASGVFPAGLERRYLDSLHAEIAGYDWPWRPETVYLGGGTPSRFEPAALAALLGLVPGRPWREATLEAAPGDITSTKAQEWLRAGIDRVSLGVQSFVHREIARTGRRHSARTVLEEVQILRAAGIDNFNIDLIAGLPGQTRDGWRQSLDWLERLEAPHVSVYMLEVDPDSRLGAELLRGGNRYGVAEVPGDDLVVELYQEAIERLGAMGIRQYEISNFARPGRQSLHNLKYWTLEPYAGFGADAHSYDGAVRRRNAESPAGYVERWERGEPACVEAVEAQPSEESFLVGLRLTAGIRPGPEDQRRYAEPIRRFVDLGLLEADGGLLRLTRRGVLLSNEVFQEFLS